MAGAGDESFPWSWRPQRRRKMVDDALFDEGDDIIGDAVKHILEPPASCEQQDCAGGELFSCQIARCGLYFSSVAEYEMHYSNSHRNTCSGCRRHFANAHLLDIHILESHNPMFTTLAQKQNMFSCLVEMCSEKFPSATSRRHHLVDVHKYPPNFRFDTQHKQHKKASLHNAVMQTPNISAAEDSATSPSGDKSKKLNSVSASGRSVPKNICFGQGSQRGFTRPRGGRGRGLGKKHWHQTTENKTGSKVNIEEVNMADLSAALETS